MTWRFTKYLFRRPLIASGIVGISIHFLIELSSRLFLGRSYISHMMEDMGEIPIYGVLRFLIPFLVPYVVTWISNRILVETATQSLIRFPQANPDVVMKLGPSGEVLFMNVAAVSTLERLGLGEGEVQQILPEDVGSIVSEIIGTDQTVIREREVRGTSFEFWFRGFPDEQAVFLSGRETTRRRELEEEVRRSYRHLVELGNFADRTFKRFDPLTFDVSLHYWAIMARLLREEEEPHFDKPTHIFFAFRGPNGRLSGHIYTKEDGQVVQDDEQIEIDPSRHKTAISLGEADVVYSNWEEENESLEEYQGRFHERVRAKVGTIESFVTYTGQDIALIGFYRGKRVNELDASVFKGLTVYAQSLKVISDQVAQTEDAFIYTIEALARAAEANDEDTGNHIVRVNEFSKCLAEELGLEAEFVAEIYYSAQMHDVGKIHLHTSLLTKPDSLTGEEFAEMAQHTIYGAKILGNAPRLAMARQIALAHHERYDGSGYPYGLKGESIPLAARIASVGDVYDALRQERSYKSAFSHEMAFRIITQGDGRVMPGHFDPQVLAAFRKVEDRVRDIFKANSVASGVQK